MKVRWVHSVFCEIQKILSRPLVVFWICLAVVFVSLVWEGSLWQLWTLNRQSARLKTKMSEVTRMSKQLNMKIQKASDLTYIDQEARDRFDLVGKDDLIFIFSDSRTDDETASK